MVLGEDMGVQEVTKGKELLLGRMERQGNKYVRGR